MHHGTALRKQLAQNQDVAPFIGVYDAMSASIAAKHSTNLFLSGFGFAASYYGLPDIGFIAWPDIVAAATRIRHILPNHKLLVDIDDGFVDPETTIHVVHQLENAGVAMVMLEDQARPRRCGHFDGKLLLPLEQYVDKLQGVLDHRRHICVMARTDASGDEIFRRVEALSRTEAEVLLVDGIRSLDTLREVRKITTKPILFNQIAGGKSPRVTLTELRDAGAQLALYSTPCLFAAQAAISESLGSIFGDDGRLPEMIAGRSVGVPQCTALLEANMHQQSRRQAALV